MRSSQVAAAAGVNPQTLRYYERRGLLAEPRRSSGGHRMYPAETVTLLRVIKAAQRLGFTLDEVAGLLSARRPHPRGADLQQQVQGQAQGKADLQQQDQEQGAAGLHQQDRTRWKADRQQQVRDRDRVHLRRQAREKLAEVEGRIADLQAVAITLRAAVEAGCDDLIACAAEPGCPVPFTPPGVERR